MTDLQFNPLGAGPVERSVMRHYPDREKLPRLPVGGIHVDHRYLHKTERFEDPRWQVFLANFR
jgi:hypothetical protein